MSKPINLEYFKSVENIVKFSEKNKQLESHSKYIFDSMIDCFININNDPVYCESNINEIMFYYNEDECFFKKICVNHINRCCCTNISYIFKDYDFVRSKLWCTQNADNYILYNENITICNDFIKETTTLISNIAKDVVLDLIDLPANVIFKDPIIIDKISKIQLLA